MDLDLVVDLRNGVCSVGLLTTENGKLGWIPQFLKTSIDQEGTYTSVVEADLACFKKDKNWIPIQRNGLPNHESDRLQDPGILFDLLSEDLDKIERPLIQVVNSLLREILKERQADLLFLVERDGLEDFLKKLSKKIGRKCQIILPPGDVGEIEAYALWDVEKEFPQEGDFIQCKYSSSLKEQAFVWKDNKFEKTSLRDHNSTDVGMEQEFLEKVGAVFFQRKWGQQWKERRFKKVQDQINEWKEKNIDSTEVLDKLRQIHFSQHVMGNI